MPRFTVTPPITGFSCEAGSVTPEEDGSFIVESGAIIAAMEGHGLRLTEVAAPPRKGRGQKEPKEEAAGGGEQTPTANNDAAALDAAMQAAIGSGT